MADYKEGDILQLNSGGPKMTYSGSTDQYGKMYCQWFAGSKLESGYFKPGMLKPAKDDKPAKAK